MKLYETYCKQMFNINRGDKQGIPQCRKIHAGSYLGS